MPEKKSGGKRLCEQIAKAREARGGQCEYKNEKGRCTQVVDLEFCHTVAYTPPYRDTTGGRGSWYRWKEIRDHKDDLRLFCGIHHQQYDEGKILVDGMYSPKFLKDIGK